MIITFGKGDELALPRLKLSETSFGSETQYTHPSYDWCYSTYGFAVPLNYEAIPLDIICNLMIPKLGLRRFDHFASEYSYLLIDHSGELWYIILRRNKEMRHRWEQVSCYIERHDDSWWVQVPFNSSPTEVNTLLGFLAANPKREQIDHLHAEMFSGRDLEWFSINEIVTKLNSDYSRDDVVDDSTIVQGIGDVKPEV